MDNCILVVLVLNIIVDLFLIVSCYTEFKVVSENSDYIVSVLKDILENCKKE